MVVARGTRPAVVRECRVLLGRLLSGPLRGMAHAEGPGGLRSITAPAGDRAGVAAGYSVPEGLNNGQCAMLG